MNAIRTSASLWHLLAILTLGVLIYADTFEVPFVLDDEEAIVENATIQELANFSPGGEGYRYNPRRWLGYFSFAVNYHFGGLDVGGYHLVNLLVHLTTALLVYLFAILTLRSPVLAQSRLAPAADKVGLLAALIFVAHPVQTQAVTYIVQRLTSLCALFYLLALVLYALARLQIATGQKAGGPAAIGRRPVALLTGAVVAAVLAMSTKEIAFTLPLAVLLYELCFFRGPWQRRLGILAPLLLTLAIIPLGVLTSADGLGEEAPAVRDLRAQSDLPRLHYLFTQFRVIVTYLRLLILPVDQNLDYDYPVYDAFLAPPVLLSFLALCLLLLLAIYLCGLRPRLLHRLPSPGPDARLIAFGIFWFFLTLSVESSLIPIKDVIFEHRLYLPLAGIALSVAALFFLAARRAGQGFTARLPLLLAAALILTLATAAWQRNQVWQSNVRLWGDVVAKSPGKVRGWYNYGSYLSDAGQMEEAIQALSQAVRLNPRHANAWHNLGRSYLLIDRDQEGVDALRRAVHLDPDMRNAFDNLMVGLLRTDRPEEVIALIEKNLYRYGDWADARLRLGTAYAVVRNFPAARRELAIVVRLDPQQAADLAALLRFLEAGGKAR